MQYISSFGRLFLAHNMFLESSTPRLLLRLQFHFYKTTSNTTHFCISNVSFSRQKLHVHSRNTIIASTASRTAYLFLYTHNNRCTCGGMYVCLALQPAQIKV